MLGGHLSRRTRIHVFLTLIQCAVKGRHRLFKNRGSSRYCWLCFKKTHSSTLGSRIKNIYSLPVRSAWILKHMRNALIKEEEEEEDVLMTLNNKYIILITSILRVESQKLQNDAEFGIRNWSKSNFSIFYWNRKEHFFFFIVWSVLMAQIKYFICILKTQFTGHLKNYNSTLLLDAYKHYTNQ